MATHDVLVRVKAEISAFKRDMEAAAQAARKTADETAKAGEKASKAGKQTEQAGTQSASAIARLGDTARAHEQAWSQVSTTMVGAGTLIVGGLTASAKAAIDWESAWAGVKKTVDGTPEQLGQVEDGLRGLARELPATHTEIAGVAEAAGQLGVARDDIVGFTKTMIDLGESTNLTAEDAATNIAQISNVMGTMSRDGVEGVQRFGATLVQLGNNGASTEAEILSMAQRIAGAGATVGATEVDVLALSNTLASMGVKAELGGGVTTRVLLKMRTAVDEGGESLEAFANAAGLSADEFATKFRNAPVEALDLVSKGIHRVNEAGGNVTAMLGDLGLKGTEEVQVMLALANSGDLLTDSLKMGADAWSENTALVNEANQRYETAASKIKIAWNNIKDAAITAGGAILPVVAGLAEGVADLVGWFGDLPKPVQQTLAVLGGVAGVALLAGGAIAKIIPAITGTIGGLKALGGALGIGAGGFGRLGSAAGKAEGSLVTIDAAMGRSEKAASKLGKAGSLAGKGLLALATVGPLIGSMVPSGKTAELDALNASLLDTNNVVSNLDSMFTGKGNWFDGLDVGGLEDAFRVIGNRSMADNVDHWVSKVLTLGSRDSSNIEFAKKNFEQLDSAITNMVKSGNLDGAAKSYDEIAGAAKAAGVPAEMLVDIFPQYAAALRLAEQESKGAADGASQLGDAMGAAEAEVSSMAQSAEEAADKLDKLLQGMFATGMATRDLQGTKDAFKASVDALSESIEKNGTTLNSNTEKGRANRQAFRDLADQGQAVVETLARQGAGQDELTDAMQSTYDELVKGYEQTGKSAEKADELARSLLGIPDDVKVETWMSEQAAQIAGLTAEAIEAIPGYKKVGIAVSEDGTVGQVQAKIDTVTGKTEYVFVTDDGTIKNLQTGIATIDGKEVPVYVDDDGTVYGTQGKIDGIDGKDVQVVAYASTGGAESDLNWLARSRSSLIYTRVVTTHEDHYSTGRGGRGGQLPGGYTGGLVGQLIQGRAGGGLVPGAVPLNSQGDNVLAMVGGKPFGLRSGEMVINERATRENYPLLKAINDGTTTPQAVARYAAERYAPAPAGGGLTAASLQGLNVSLDARSIQAIASAVQPYLVLDNHAVAQANGAASRRNEFYGKY